jgi:cysteine desulfurase
MISPEGRTVTRQPIYLDHHASTPVDPFVLEAMLPYFCETFGNPQPLGHAFARQAHHAVEKARRQIAAILGAHPDEIVFTSGATESINLALQGTLRRFGAGRVHIITSAVEHAATLRCLEALRADLVDVTVLGVDDAGRVAPEAIASAIRPDTRMVSLIHGNNEIGTLTPIAPIGAITRQRGVLLHIDATQTFGRIPLHPDTDCFDLLSLSGHKIYGPKGVGALYVRRRNPRVALEPMVYGGEHERGRRSGTLNVPGIVGLGAAAILAVEKAPEERQRLRGLRECMAEALLAAVPALRILGDRTQRLDGHLSVAIHGIQAGALMAAVPNLAFSAGATCAAGKPGPSHVLQAIGLEPDLAAGAIRVGIGRGNTQAEIDHATAELIQAIASLRAPTHTLDDTFAHT